MKRIRIGSGLEGRIRTACGDRTITGRNGISNQTVLVPGGKLVYHYVIILSLIVSPFRVFLPLHCRRMRETSNGFLPFP